MPFRINPITNKLDYYPKLDDCATPDDNTDLNASASKHGLLLKLDDDTGKWLRSDGAWQAIPNLDTLTDDSMADSLHRHSELSASDGTPDSVVRVDSNGNISLGIDGGEDVIYLSRHSDASNYVDLQAGTADENKGVGFKISYRSATGTSRLGIYLSDTGVFSVAGNTVVDEATTNYVTLTDNSIANTLHRHSELVASDGNPDPALSVDNTGKVGIGTADPGAKLEISGEAEGIRITGTGTTGDASLGYLTFYDSNGTTRRGFIGDASSNNDDIYLQAETGDLHLGDSSGALVMNFNSGNVGIGETTPAAKLDVNGNLILQNGTSINEFSIDGTLGGNSDDAVPTEQAVKTYADAIGTLLLTHASRHQNTGGDEINVGGLSGELADAQPPKAHTHDGDTLQLDGINSNGGAFAFTTTGTITFNQDLLVNSATTISNSAVKINFSGSGNRTAQLDLRGDDTNIYGLRLLRNGGGVNTTSEIYHRGIGDFIIAALDAGPMVFKTTNSTRMTIAAGGDVTIANNLRVDGGQIGITADTNLISMANGALTVNGTLTATGIITGATHSKFGNTDINSNNIEINTHGSGNRYAFIDFIGDDTYSDFGLRLIRYNTGANALSELVARGTGGLTIGTGEAGAMVLYTTNTTRIVIAATGEVTMPTQPAFSVTLDADQNNIAVDTITTVQFDDERYDQGNNFNTGGYTFTAPVTGKYHFDVQVYLQTVDTGAANYSIDLVTSNRSYTTAIDTQRFSADLNMWTLNLSVDADMDANDTAEVRVYQNGGTQQTDIRYNGAGSLSFFTGHLVA